MSVVLGIVAWTKGLRSVHLSAASMPPWAASFSRVAAASGPRPPAITFIATTPTPASCERLHERVVAIAHREVVGDEDDVQLLRDRGGDDLRVAGVQAHAGEADLALLLRDALRVEQFVGDVRGLALAVQVPDVDVVGAELLQALVEVRERVRLRWRRPLFVEM